MWKCSDWLETVMWSAMETYFSHELSDSTIHQSDLIDAIRKRSEMYTNNRQELNSKTNQNAYDLAARALFFSLADAPKLSIPLTELASRDALPASDQLSILDIGAGTGVMSLAAISILETFGKSVSEVTAVDQDARALSVLEHIKLNQSLKSHITTQVSDIRFYKSHKQFDLIIIGSVLNELKDNEAQVLIGSLLKQLHANGALIIIEPAFCFTTRALHRLRDYILDSEQAHVFAPCVRSISPCPALARKRDWCHEIRSIELSNKAKGLAKITGLRDKVMKFSYLVLRKELHPRLATVSDEQLNVEPARIISGVHTQKGKVEFTGCSQSGFVSFRLLRRNKTQDNRKIFDLKRGNILYAQSDIGKEDRVIILDPSNPLQSGTP